MDGAFNRPSMPILLTSFVGRQHEIAAVAGLFRSGIRLVTLTGTGGSGKTRLAMQVATDVVSDFADGVIVVPLAPLHGADHVLSAIAVAFGIQESVQDLPETVAMSVFGDRQCLLVLDNFEHVLDAAPMVGELMQCCPRLSIMVTSRSPLHLYVEQEFPVPPLAVPGTRRSRVDDLLQIPSVELFVQRARATNPAFTLNASNAQAIADICLRLDGLPLAIELAAARVKVLSPDALLDRLSSRLRVLIGGARDQPARLQTMRNAIGWSYELLDEREQGFFRQLSVFVGGFTLEAAESVIPGDDTLELLGGLVDQSLVQQMPSGDGVRFTFLETIREFAQEKLVASNEEVATRRQHAAWCQRLARQTTTADLRRALPDQVRQVAAEQDNFRAALAWLQHHEPVEALRLAVWLCPFWYAQGMLREAHHWLERTLATGDAADADLRARGLFTLAKIQSEADDVDQDQAIAIFKDSLALSIEAGDDQFAARCLSNIALAEERAGRDAQALARYEESLERYAAAGDDIGVINQLVNLGDTAWRLGDLERSEQYCRTALAHPAVHDDRFDLAMVRVNLAQIAVVRGDGAEAHAHLLAALDDVVAIAFQIGIIDVIAGMAALAQAAGQSTIAARWLGTVAASCQSVGMAMVPHHGLWRRTLTATQSSLTDAAFASAHQTGTLLSLDDAVDELRAWQMPKVPRSAVGTTMNAVVLSPREQEVLRLLVAGQTDRQIADALYISPRTAQHHVANIFNKLGVNSRTAAATAAILTGLVDATEAVS